jgi:L-asparaginase
MKITGYPGINFSDFNLDSNPAAVLYVPYHSGTACAISKNGQEYSMCEFVKKCLLKDIMVYVCGIKKSAAMYDTTRDIIGAGSIPMYNISDPAAYMKLLIAYNQVGKPVGEILRRNLYFEILGEGIK